MEIVPEIRNEGGLVSETTTGGPWSGAASRNVWQAGELFPRLDDEVEGHSTSLHRLGLPSARSARPSIVVNSGSALKVLADEPAP